MRIICDGVLTLNSRGWVFTEEDASWKFRLRPWSQQRLYCYRSQTDDDLCPPQRTPRLGKSRITTHTTYGTARWRTSCSHDVRTCSTRTFYADTVQSRARSPIHTVRLCTLHHGKPSTLWTHRLISSARPLMTNDQQFTHQMPDVTSMT